MKVFLTVLLVSLSFVVLAASENLKITGEVKDSVTQKPVEFATVALIDANGKAIDGALCDDKGRFTLNKVTPGRYKVTITFIGFETKIIPVEINEKDIELGTISISPVAKVLKEVTVEGQRAIIEERVDRTIYNAENDETAKGGDATDVLKRVPMLSVDMDGNVSLRGSQNIMVLINNKPSSIVASSVADALKQIPADEIKAVEVITSPSAKYDAEGSAGIINIVTKKNNFQGLTLNINSGIGLRGSNLGLNGNYRKGKMGFSLGGWGRSNYNVNGSFENQQLTTDPATGQEALSIQSADTKSHGLFGNYNFGWDYDINEKNNLAASVRFGVRDNANDQDNLLNRQYDDADNLLASSLRDANSSNQSHNIDVNLSYTHLYSKPQRELSFQGRFGRNDQNSNFENFIKNESDLSTSERLKNINDSYNQEMTLQADYQSPISTNQMIEFGGKDIMRKVFSDYTYFAATGAEGPYEPSSNAKLNNNLNYDQNITAGYLSYTLTTKKSYSVKAGARYEYTTISAYTETEDDIQIPSYGILVPSVNVAKKLKNGNMVKASYNRRIQRPSIRYLNPNIEASNPLNIRIGNPELDPEYTNNYELSYSTFIKGTTLNFSAFTRQTNDAIQSVRDVIGKTASDPDTIRTSYQNIGQEDAYGMSLFANVNIGKLSLNGGGDVYYAVLDNKLSDPLYHAANEGWAVSGRIFGNYNLDKGWGLQFFSFVRGRHVQLQGTQSGFYMYSLAVRKQFNEGRGSIGIGAENFLTSAIKMKTNLESPILIQQSVNTRNNLSFRINFSYRIGKMTLENTPRRSSKRIINDDLKEGSEGMDGMQMGAEGGGQPMGNTRMPMSRRQHNQWKKNDNPKPDTASVTQGTIYEPAGTWSYTLDSPRGGSGTIVLKKENNTYSGSVKSNRMNEEIPVNTVTVNGNEIVLSYSVTFGGNTVPVEIKAVLTSASEMQGTIQFDQSRSFDLKAKKSGASD